MPKTFLEVQDEYNTWKDQYGSDPRVAQTPLTEYAKAADESAQTPGERSSAYNDNILKRVDAMINRGFHATPLPAVSKFIFGTAAEPIDQLFGTNVRPTVERVAEELPRGAVESLATIPVAATGAGAPAAAGVWLNRINQIRNFLKPIGYASTGLQGYSATDSPLGAAINMGSMKLANKLLLPEANAGWDVGRKVEEPLRDWLTKRIPDIDVAAGKTLTTPRPGLSPLTGMESAVPAMANVGTQAAAATALNEATRQAQMSVGPNRVPLTDWKQRNPFTPENIAAQATGAAAFVPQAVTAFRDRPPFQSKQASQWLQWAENRRQALEESGIMSWTPKDFAYNTAEERQQAQAKGVILNAMIEQYRHARQMNDPMAEKYNKVLMRLFDEDGWTRSERKLAGEYMEGMTDESVAAATREPGETPLPKVDTFSSALSIDALSKSVADKASMPMTTLKDFGEFKLELNTLIDQLNEAGAKGLGETKFVKGQYVPPLESEKGKTWHPTPTSAEAVGQLQKQKLLPEITDEWFRVEMGKELEKGVDPNTALDIVKQRAANFVLDAVPAALEARAKMPLDETGADWKLPGSKKSNVEKQQEVAQLNQRFADALTQLPGDIREGVVHRTIEFLNQNPVISKYGKTKGRQVGQYAAWRLAVIKSIESFDPDSGTILMYTGSKVDPVSGKKTSQFNRVPISELVRTDETSGNYIFNPRWSPVATAEGGKKVGWYKGKTVPEGNLEDLVQPENIVSDTMADEADYNRALAEEGAWKGSLEDQMSTTKGGEVGGPATPESVKEFGMAEPEFLTVPEGPAADKWRQKAQTLKKNISMLTDQELNNITDVFYQRKTPTGKVYADAYAKGRRPFMRTALLAALDQLLGEKGGELSEASRQFLSSWEAGKTAKNMTERQRLLIALKDFFKKDTPVEGAPAGLANHEARFGQIAQALLDDRRIQETVNRRNEVIGRLALSDGIDPALVISNNDIPTPFYHGTYPDSWKNKQIGESPLKTSSTWGMVSTATSPEFVKQYKAVFPLFIKAGKYFDYASPQERKLIAEALLQRNAGKGKITGMDDAMKAKRLLEEGETGYFEVIEADSQDNGPKNNIFTKLGYDGIWTYEGGSRNLHVFNPDEKFVYLSKGKDKHLTDIWDLKLGEFGEGGRPEDFTARVREMLTPRINQALGEAGYSGSMRGLFTEMAVALAMQAKGLPSRLYRLENVPEARGMTTARGEIGRVGLVLSDVMTPKEVHTLLKTLAHEIEHIQQLALDGHIPGIDAFSQHQRQTLGDLRSLANLLTPDERNGILTTLQEVLVPREFWDIPVVKDTGRLYGSDKPDEFTAQLSGLLAGSLLNPKIRGEFSPFEILSWMPSEIRDYSYGFFRSIEDIFDAVQTAMGDPAFRKEIGAMPLPEGLQKQKQFSADAVAAILAMAREGTRLRDTDINAKAMMEQVALLSPESAQHPPPQHIQDAVWRASQATIRMAYKGSGLEPPVYLSESVKGAIDAAKEVFYRPVKDPTTRPGLWARWFYPFSQLMYSMERSGVPLARPLGILSTGLAGGIKRTQSLFMSPWVVKNPDGTVKLDHTNLLIDKLGLEKTGRWRDAVNEVSAWQQEKGASVTMFVKGEDGRIVVNPVDPKIQEKWDSISKGMKPEDQQVVMNASVALDEMGQLEAARIVATMQKSMEYNVAATLMQAYKMDYDKAKEMAATIVPAYLQLQSKVVEERTAAIELINRFVTPGPLRDRLDGLMVSGDGLIPKFIETKDRLLARVGYRTESLPGDYIIRFRKPGDGENDFHYLSARTEAQANHLARRLQSEDNVIIGEIAKKSEIRDYAEFDDPDAILRSFIKAEQSKWQQMVDAMRESHGDEVANALMEYSPGVEAERFLATKGMGKTLVHRESKVDRSRFDYIDAAIEGAQRLATSLEYRLARQEKNLILSDKRAKLYPSLKPLVNNHFDELMSPMSRTGQEMRTLAGAFMMGGSLASAVINGSQSLTTLLPVLIQGMAKGGIVSAYRLLGRNIADMVKISTDTRWQQIAAQAELKDPAKWTLEESKYALYKRNVEEGGIDHGVILDEIFSGTDTRSMLTSKFGRGDYGPVTKGDLARNGLYLAAQLSLKPFGWVEKQNNKVALLSGIEQGYEKGLRGEALYDYARTVKSLATFGGGKSNAPGLVGRLSTEYTRSAVGMVNVLQQYGYGVVALYAQLAKDGLGRSPALSPLERRQAQKAFLTMFATQVALGGALGLPFVGAALTLIEQLTGTPANQLVRQGLADLGTDEEAGPVIAETALNGLGNQMFGFDVSSRVGVASILGTSAYRGFNLADMVGPGGSILKNAADALNYFGQSRPDKAIHSLVPNSIRTAVELYNTNKQFGDYGVRDQGGNLLHQLSPNEAAMYVLGFRPTEVSRKRQMQRLVTTANTLATQKQGNEFDDAAAALIRGDTNPAQETVRRYASVDPLIDPQEMLRSIVNRAVDAQTPKDVLATGPRAAEGARTAIAGTFQPEVNPRQSEVDRQVMAMQLGVKLGLRPDPLKLRHAAMVDALINGGRMPRSEALRIVEFLK